MKKLTKAEESIMHVLWDMKKGFVKDIIELLPGPKPAYNTISTIVRILVKKGFLDHKSYGNSHQYFPIISKAEYTKEYFGNFLQNYFSNSYAKLVNFFSQQNDFTVTDVDEIMKMLRKIKKQKGIKDE